MAIGNSFSVDAMEYFYQIANDLGVDNIKLGNLYIGGCSLDTHYANMISNSASYTYYTNSNGKWSENAGYSLKTALTSENWDYITFQQASGSSGEESTYSNLVNLIAEVKAVCPDTKLVWHMTWAYQGDSTHGDFSKYSNDQMTMYQAIITAVQNQIITNEDIVMLIPAGTAIQNARTSFLGDTLTRDGYHLSLDMGRYIAGITWVEALTGLDVSNLTYCPAGISEDEKALAIESAKNALKNPYTVTNSEHTLENDYIQLDLKFSTGFYNSVQDTQNPPVLYPWTDSLPYYATKVFTKAELPVGTIIVYTGNIEYRPDGWVNGVGGSRPGSVKSKFVMIDEAWWGNWTERGFNIKVASTSVTADEVAEVFKIYVPKSAYERVELTIYKAFYNASIYTSTRMEDATSSLKFFGTQTFTKDTLPVGSIILNNAGSKIRYEGWYDGSSSNPDRARGENSTAQQIVVDESWWGKWTVRGFNIPVSSLEDSEIEKINSQFIIYVPK